MMNGKEENIHKGSLIKRNYKFIYCIAKRNYKFSYCIDSLQTFEIELYRLVCQLLGQGSSKETAGVGF